jgi:FtsZ-interacting cell division protein ZipA
VSQPFLVPIAFIVALVVHEAAFAAASETAKADAARKKPLQRCDQMTDQAELDCLKKARERIVADRKKREGAAQKQDEKQSSAAQKKDERQSKTAAQR